VLVSRRNIKRISRIPLTFFHRSFTVCSACQGLYSSIRARENFSVGQVVMLIPANVGNYRDFSDAAGGPLVLGQQEPIDQVSDTRIRSARGIYGPLFIFDMICLFCCSSLDFMFPGFAAGGMTVPLSLQLQLCTNLPLLASTSTSG
jgi:hypothetical protein